jgi:hypothetical protein
MTKMAGKIPELYKILKDADVSEKEEISMNK